MKVARFVSLLLFIATSLLGQSNLVPANSRQNANGSTFFEPLKDARERPKILEDYGKLPLSFEANQGQTDPGVRFLARTNRYTLFLTGDEAVFSFSMDEPKLNPLAFGHRSRPKPVGVTADVLRIKLVSGNPTAQVKGEDELPETSNYFIGNDPKKWHPNIPNYAKVRYEDIYSGIDLVYYGNQRRLEYDFIVAPGADPNAVAFDIRGAKSIRRERDGCLLIATSEGELRWDRPVVYQEKAGARYEIAARYRIAGSRRVGFKLAKYDPKRPLYIDPLIYSTYLGGNKEDVGAAIAVDGAGNSYVTGLTSSLNFPVTLGAFQTVLKGSYNVFVSKLSPSGSALIYSTFLGGSAGDDGDGIALDSLGDAYVTGGTCSTDFPTTPGAYQTTYGGGDCVFNGDGFVAELNPSGSGLLYSTYLGGSSPDIGYGIAVDSSGSAYVIGYTQSTDFPTMNPLQPAFGGGEYDAFVSKLNPTGSSLIYSTYLGGSGPDSGYGIALDSVGNAYVTGSTSSTNFPVTSGAFQTVCGSASSCSNAFVSELNPSGAALVYSTYLGGSTSDGGASVSVDSGGNAHVTGYTTSANFPTMNPVQRTYAGGGDAFVSELNGSGSGLVYSTFLGGSGQDFGSGIALDAAGNTYVAGYTASTDFPTMNPLQASNGGGGDAFVSEFNASGSELVYSTFLGGSGSDSGIGIATDDSDNAYVTGYTESTNFPTMNPFQPAFGGGTSSDAFVSKIGPTPAVTVVPGSIDFGNVNVGATSASQNVTMTNSGGAPLSLSSIAGTGDFAQTNTCPVGGSLAAGSSCTISVTFTPTAEGTRNGAVTITDNAAGSPQTVPLSGVGLQASVTLNPPSVNFGNKTVGGNGVNQGVLVNLTNTGNVALTISSIAITGADSGDFIQSNLCPSSLAAGLNCTISVQFVPTTTGTRTGALTVTDNAANSPQSVSLTGVGVLPAVSLSPASLSFPTQVVFTNSKTQTVTLNNTGLGYLFITNVAVSGPFTQTNTCGSTVNPGSSCTFTVTFKPTKAGAVTGSLSITDNAPLSPQTVSLKGTGTYVQFNPVSFNFGNQPVGTKSLPKKITLSNKGSVPISITKISLTGINAADFSETNTCGTRVAAGASCFITVTFTPSAKSKRTANVSVSDNGGGSPQTVSLSGTGT